MKRNKNILFKNLCKMVKNNNSINLLFNNFLKGIKIILSSQDKNLT